MIRKHRTFLSILQIWLASIAFLQLSACRASNNLGQRPELKSTPATPASSIQFGLAPQHYEVYSPIEGKPREVDIVVVSSWLLKDGTQEVQEKAIREITAAGKTPYVFGYITAATIKDSLNTKRDCDGDTKAELCQGGAEQIRKLFKTHILPTWKRSAKQISDAANGHEVLIHLEPDWMQYSEKSQKKPLSKRESHTARNQIIRAIKTNCASCRIVLDFSTWYDSTHVAWAPTVQEFFGEFDRDVVKFVGLTGKPFPFTTDKIDNFSYKEISEALDLPLLVTSAYDFGGGPTPLDTTWFSDKALTEAPEMGVAGVILSFATPDYFQKFLAGEWTPELAEQAAQTAQKKPAQEADPNQGPNEEMPLPEPGDEIAETPPPQDDAPPSDILPEQNLPPLPEETPGSTTEQTPVATTFTVMGGDFKVDDRITSDWSAAYCRHFNIRNLGKSPARWTVRTPIKGKIYSSWGMKIREEKGMWIFDGLEYNVSLIPGQESNFGYCANH